MYFFRPGALLDEMSQCALPVEMEYPVESALSESNALLALAIESGINRDRRRNATSASRQGSRSNGPESLWTESRKEPIFFPFLYTKRVACGSKNRIPSL